MTPALHRDDQAFLTEDGQRALGCPLRHPVPHAVSKGVTWCAQRLPLINVGSVAELDAAIAEAEADDVAEAQAFGHPALDSESQG